MANDYPKMLCIFEYSLFFWCCKIGKKNVTWILCVLDVWKTENWNESFFWIADLRIPWVKTFQDVFFYLESTWLIARQKTSRQTRLYKRNFEKLHVLVTHQACVSQYPQDHPTNIASIHHACCELGSTLHMQGCKDVSKKVEWSACPIKLCALPMLLTWQRNHSLQSGARKTDAADVLRSLCQSWHKKRNCDSDGKQHQTITSGQILVTSRPQPKRYTRKRNFLNSEKSRLVRF